MKIGGGMFFLKIKNFVCFSFLLLFSLGAYSQGGRAVHYGSVTQATSTTPSTQKIEEDLAKQQAQKKDQNIKNQADKASRSQNLGMVTGIAAASYFAYKAYQSCSVKKPDWTCPAYVAATALSGKVAMDMSKAKSQSDKSYFSVTEGLQDDLNKISPEERVNQDKRMQEAQARLDKIAKEQGIIADFSEGTALMPDGKKINAANLSPQDLSAVGFGSNEQEAFKNLLSEGFKKAEEEATAVVDRLNGDVISEGSGSGGSGIAADVVIEAYSSGSKNKDKKINRDPSQVAGLSKNFNGDPIAVASENLFVLINRRYDFKAKTDSFILKGE